MQIIIDIGNTVQKVAIYNGDELQVVYQYTQLDIDILNQLLVTEKPKKWILSSVANHNVALEKVLNESLPGLCFNHTTPLPIINSYKTPQTLGNDRLANAVGANYLFPDKNVLIVDAGTCIKYDFISSEGNYSGGAISPGLQMRFLAMHQLTARLPLIDSNEIIHAETLNITGDSTESAMLSGGALGAVLEVEGFIAEYSKLYKDITIILTGGNMPFFVSHLKSRIFAIPNLTLTGLNAALEYNSRDI